MRIKSILSARGGTIVTKYFVSRYPFQYRYSNIATTRYMKDFTQKLNESMKLKMFDCCA